MPKFSSRMAIMSALRRDLQRFLYALRSSRSQSCLCAATVCSMRAVMASMPRAPK
jgi:hypothetical protein